MSLFKRELCIQVNPENERLQDRNLRSNCKKIIVYRKPYNLNFIELDISVTTDTSKLRFLPMYKGRR